MSGRLEPDLDSGRLPGPVQGGGTMYSAELILKASWSKDILYSDVDWLRLDCSSSSDSQNRGGKLI